MLLTTFAALLLVSDPVPPTDWTQFHGGALGGVRTDVKLPAEWSTTKNVAWSTEIPGQAWSSPVTWKGKIFLTTAVREGELAKKDQPIKGLYMGGERTKAPEVSYTWKVLCVDEETGKILWDKAVHKGTPDKGKHIKNSYASETPVVDADRLYVCFGNIGLFAFDHQGNLLWKYAIESMPTTFSWGPAASPTVYDNKVYFVYDNEKDSYILCLDARTGSQLWREKREEKSNWSTPFVWANDKRTEIVTAGRSKVRSYDPDGKLLWELGGMSSITVPTPVSAGGMLFVSSGYVMDSKRPVFAIKPGASGDISLKKEEKSNEFIEWFQPTAGAYMPTPLVYDGLCYVLYDSGMFACYEAKTGKEVYGKQRFKGKSSTFTASPWAYGGKIFCLNEDGDTFVVEAGREFKQVRVNSLEELSLASPAITSKSLLIRTASKLYCIR